MAEDLKAPKKTCSAPSLMERSREQATLFLVGHAWIGDTGARRLLELFFPESWSHDGAREITSTSPALPCTSKHVVEGKGIVHQG